MIGFALDEDFDERLVRALVRRAAPIPIDDIKSGSRRGMPDSAVLAWAAERGLVLLSHDANTMVAAARDRIARGEPMRGLLIVRRGDFAAIVEDLELIASLSEPGEWDDRIDFLPWPRKADTS